MATEVSSWGRLLNSRRENASVDGGNSDVLITRDLLGNLSNGKNREMGFDESKVNFTLYLLYSRNFLNFLLKLLDYAAAKLPEIDITVGAKLEDQERG